MFLYAQINENNKVVSVSQLSGEVIAENLIRIEDSNGTNLLGYIYEGGRFIEPEPEIIIEEPDKLEILQQELSEQKALINAMLGVTE
jgi:hypothetical protein